MQQNIHEAHILQRFYVHVNCPGEYAQAACMPVTIDGKLTGVRYPIPRFVPHWWTWVQDDHNHWVLAEDEQCLMQADFCRTPDMIANHQNAWLVCPGCQQQTCKALRAGEFCAVYGRYHMHKFKTPYPVAALSSDYHKINNSNTWWYRNIVLCPFTHALSNLNKQPSIYAKKRVQMLECMRSQMALTGDMGTIIETALLRVATAYNALKAPLYQKHIKLWKLYICTHLDLLRCALANATDDVLFTKPHENWPSLYELNYPYAYRCVSIPDCTNELWDVPWFVTCNKNTKIVTIAHFFHSVSLANQSHKSIFGALPSMILEFF